MVSRTMRRLKLKLYLVVASVLPLFRFDGHGGHSGVLTEAARAEDELRLLRRFLDRSVKNTRPVNDTLDAVRVVLDITLHSVVDMDERHQILTTNIWLRQEWQNQFFQWDPSEYGGVKHVIVESSEVWLPDTILYTNVFEEFDGRMDHIPTRVKISNNGHTFWAAPLVFKTSCRIDVSNFPFDHQQCRLKFSSWSHHLSELDLWNVKNFSQKTNTSVEHGEWEVRNITIRRNTPKYECCPNETYPDVTFTIHLKRRSLFYIVNLILPNFLIAMLGFFSFFIPVECGERISFVITVLLSMTVFLLLVAENIPATSDAVPVIGVFFILSLVEIALALVATGITLKIYYSYLYGHGLSPRMKRFLFQKLGPLLRFSSETLPKLEATKLTAPKADSSGCPHSPRILTKTKRRLLTEIDSCNVEMANRHGIHSEEGNEPATFCNGHAGESESFFVAAKNDADEHSTKDLNRRDISEAESRIAAAIVDRACMWIFSVIFFLSTAVVMLMPFVRHNDFA